MVKQQNNKTVEEVYRNITYSLNPIIPSNLSSLQVKEARNEVYKKLWKSANACRILYNHFLAENNKEYKEYVPLKLSHKIFGVPEVLDIPKTSYMDLCKKINKNAKNVARENLTSDNLPIYLSSKIFSIPFVGVSPLINGTINGVSKTILRSSLEDLSRAFDGMFKKRGGRPKFKSKRKTIPSFGIPYDVNICVNNQKNTTDVVLTIPMIKTKFKLFRKNYIYLDCKAKTARIKYDKPKNKWMVVISYQVPINHPDLKKSCMNGKVVGIDRNTSDAAYATSDEKIYPLPDLKILNAKKARLQRKKSKQIEGSKRHKLTLTRIAKVSRKMANIKDDFRHQKSRQFANEYQYVVLEDLNIKGMTKSAKGNAKKHGKNVKAKSGLNREFLNPGHYDFEQKLSYKTEVIKVPPHYTSIKCNKCKKDVERKGRKISCSFCGYENEDMADINAAKNIRDKGIEQENLEHISNKTEVGVASTGRREAFSSETSMTRQKTSPKFSSLSNNDSPKIGGLKRKKSKKSQLNQELMPTSIGRGGKFRR